MCNCTSLAVFSSSVSEMNASVISMLADMPSDVYILLSLTNRSLITLISFSSFSLFKDAQWVFYSLAM